MFLLLVEFIEIKDIVNMGDAVSRVCVGCIVVKEGKCNELQP